MGTVIVLNKITQIPCSSIQVTNNVKFTVISIDRWCLPRFAPSGEASVAPFNSFNPLRPRQNGRHFADDTLNRIFLNENVRISIKISLKFAPKGPISNIPSLVQIMAWRRPGDKPLTELMMVSLLTHICVTRPQWVKLLRTNFNPSPPGQNVSHFADDIFGCVFEIEKFCILIKISLTLSPRVQITITKPLSDRMLTRLTDAYI